MDGLEKAKVQLEIERAIKDARSIKKRSVLETIVMHYKNFDDIVFSMADASKQSIDEINRMNVYQFYSFKRFLQDKAKELKSKMNVTDEH